MAVFALDARGARSVPLTHGQYATNVSKGQQIAAGQSTDNLTFPFLAYDCDLLPVGSVGLTYVFLTLLGYGITIQVAAQIVTPAATGGQIEFTVGEDEAADNFALLPTLLQDRQQSAVTVPSGATGWTTTLYTAKTRFVAVRLRNNDAGATTSWKLKTALRQAP